jgi:hypothetical protein
MTAPLAPRGRPVECAHCGKRFRPSKYGHRFCSRVCRHRGEREPHQHAPVDHEAVARLFDRSRDPSERVRPNDWFPPVSAEWAALFAHDTLEARRRWYAALIDLGRL